MTDEEKEQTKEKVKDLCNFFMTDDMRIGLDQCLSVIYII